MSVYTSMPVCLSILNVALRGTLQQQHVVQPKVCKEICMQRTKQTSCSSSNSGREAEQHTNALLFHIALIATGAALFPTQLLLPAKVACDPCLHDIQHLLSEGTRHLVIASNKLDTGHIVTSLLAKSLYTKPVGIHGGSLEAALACHCYNIESHVALLVSAI